MLAPFGLSALSLLVPPAQDAIVRGTPWYWPVGDAFEPGRILQGYGQYETVHDVDSVHQGLDIAAAVDDTVRAPIGGTVLGIWWPESVYPAGTKPIAEPYGSVILGAEEGDWGLTVTHLYDITVLPGDEVVKGQELGRVSEWVDLPTFSQVHLGVFSPVPSDVYGSKTYMADPLVFLGGRSDEWTPFFLDVEDSGGSTSYWPVAFVDDVPAGGGTLDFHEPDSLPEAKLDIVAHVGDYFRWSWAISPSPFLPIVIDASFTPHPELSPLAGIELRVFPFGGTRVAPKYLSVRITRDSGGEEVYRSTVEFTGTVTDYAYLETGTLVSEGWPDADFYYLLTHSATTAGAWDTSDPETGGPGWYTVEITAEDAAGNIAYTTTSANVDGP